MIDFQNGGLEHQVFELISKMCDLSCSDEFPHFVTNEQESGMWECKLSIPGVKATAIAHGKTEVEAINQCALCMRFILKKDHNKDQLDPDVEDSIFAGNIEQFFGDINYDRQYRYHLCETDLLLDSTLSTKLFNNYGNDTLRRINEDGEEIDQVSEIITIRLLVKEKKKNYC